jgi:hypothetical protein
MLDCTFKYISTDPIIAVDKLNKHVNKEIVDCSKYVFKPTATIELTDDNTIRGNLKYFRYDL